MLFVIGMPLLLSFWTGSVAKKLLLGICIVYSVLDK